MIELNPDQQLALQQGLPIRVHDDTLNRDVVVLSAEAFAAWEELVRDEQEQEAIVRMAMRHTAQRILEDENAPAG